MVDCRAFPATKSACAANEAPHSISLPYAMDCEKEEQELAQYPSADCCHFADADVFWAALACNRNASTAT